MTSCWSFDRATTHMEPVHYTSYLKNCGDTIPNNHGEANHCMQLRLGIHSCRGLRGRMGWASKVQPTSHHANSHPHSHKIPSFAGKRLADPFMETIQFSKQTKEYPGFWSVTVVGTFIKEYKLLYMNTMLLHDQRSFFCKSPSSPTKATKHPM